MNDCHVGFTGTRAGMTELQKREFREILENDMFYDFHHGDAEGADSDAHQILRLGFGHARIHVHPCMGVPLRNKGDVFHDPKAPLERNRVIVDETNYLIATPKDNYEILRSGTWATVRYARKAGRLVFVIYPDGKVIREEPT